jgi:anti-sigma B factor antagonist
MAVEDIRAGSDVDADAANDAGARFTRLITPDDSVLQVSGDLDIAVSVALGAELDALLDLGHERVGIDLSQVAFMDSSALGALVHAHERARELGQRLELLQPSAPCAKVFSITGLDRVFDIT